jgi:hypothetical protein
LTIAPFVIGAAAMYNWVISPHVGYLHAMQRLDPVMGRMADEVGRVSGALDEKLSGLRAMERELAKSRNQLFTQDESRRFIHDLQDLVESAGCAVIAVEVTGHGDPAAATDPNLSVAVRSFRFGVTATGQQEQIVALLRSLRQRCPRVWVHSCRLESHDSQGERLEANLSLAIDAAIPMNDTSQSKENDHVGTVQEQEEDGSGEDPDRR